MADSKGRTKRSVERGKGRTRNTGAQTSRQEAQAVELIRRAFASPSGSMWDDVPGREQSPVRFKEANVDREVLQRQNVNANWPFPDDMTKDEWGDSQSRRIRQYHPSHFEAKRLAEDGRPPMSSSSPMNGRNYDPYAPQYAQRTSNRNFGPGWYMNEQEGLYEALGRLFGR